MIRTGSSIVSASTLGMIVVDCRQLKETFLPVPRACLEALQRALPSLACRTNKRVAEQMHAASFQLEADPSTTEEFVDSLSFVENIDNVMEGIEKELKLVTDLYALIDRFSIEAPPEDVAEFEAQIDSISGERNSLFESFNGASKVSRGSGKELGQAD